MPTPIQSPSGYAATRAMAFADIDGSALLVSAASPMPVTAGAAPATPLAGSTSSDHHRRALSACARPRGGDRALGLVERFGARAALDRRRGDQAPADRRRERVGGVHRQRLRTGVERGRDRRAALSRHRADLGHARRSARRNRGSTSSRAGSPRRPARAPSTRALVAAIRSNGALPAGADRIAAAAVSELHPRRERRGFGDQCLAPTPTRWLPGHDARPSHLFWRSDARREQLSTQSVHVVARGLLRREERRRRSAAQRPVPRLRVRHSERASTCRCCARAPARCACWSTGPSPDLRQRDRRRLAALPQGRLPDLAQPANHARKHRTGVQRGQSRQRQRLQAAGGIIR